jgi:hypothetical protein
MGTCPWKLHLGGYNNRSEYPNPDPLNYETSTASSSTKRGEMLDEVCKH